MARAESEIREILAHPFDYDGWIAQGLGLLRLHLNDDGSQRLHIWDLGTALNRGVVSAHDHRWDLDSKIYFGRMGNQRYRVGEGVGMPAVRSFVTCSIGSQMVGERPQTQMAEAGPREFYEPGDSYQMEAAEFHDSFPEPGTVTVVTKTDRPERDLATIVWAGGGDWIQDEFVRIATVDEILHFTSLVAAS